MQNSIRIIVAKTPRRKKYGGGMTGEREFEIEVKIWETAWWQENALPIWEMVSSSGW